MIVWHETTDTESIPFSMSLLHLHICGTIQYGYRECGTIQYGYRECGTIQYGYGECGTTQ